jgi:hypothetical protein
MTSVIFRRIGRAFRIGATAMMLSVSILFIVLWARNFWRADVAWTPFFGGGHVVFASHEGQTEIVLEVPSRASRPVPLWQQADAWGIQTYAATPKSIAQILFAREKPYRYRQLPSGRGHEFNVIAPYWFLVPVTCLLAATPWVRWSTRFGLRTFLIITTIIALAIGAYATSKW